MNIPNFLLAIVVFSSCAHVKVKTSYDPSVDFTQYKSWCWLQGCELTYQGPNYLYDSATLETIGNLVAVEMYEKGFVQLDDNSDMIVDFHIIVKEDSAIFSMVHEEDVPFLGPNTDDYYRFLRGTLVIDIRDGPSGRMIWRTQAERLMSMRPDLKNSDIRRGVKKAMRDFPPTPTVTDEKE